MTGGLGRVPDLRQRIERRRPHLGAAGLAADVERHAYGLQPKALGIVHQADGGIAIATEFAGQRPVGLARLDDQADIHVRTGGNLGDLLKLFLGIGGKEGDPVVTGPFDILTALDGVTEGNLVGGRALAKANLDLAARGGVEVRAKLDEAGDHLTSGVGLDRIVDVGAAETGLQRAVLRLDPINVDHQRRPIKVMRGDKGIKARRGVEAGGGIRPGKHYSHGHLQ